MTDLNYIWAGMMILSILFGILNGRMGEVSQAVMEGGSNAVQLMLVLLGAMCLWSGLMRIAEKGGLTAIISKILSPITKWIFRGMDPKSPAGKAISMNMTANLLGLGNAATPLGLHAMKEMQRHNPEKQRATNWMVLFVVLNTASIQLIPTTVAAVRSGAGCSTPFDILPAVWLASALSVTAGICAAKLLRRVWR